MLMGKGVAHALEYDFRLVPPAVMAPLQRRSEGRLRQTLLVLLGSGVFLSWPGSERNSLRAPEAWALGLLRWAMRHRQRIGLLLIMHKAVMSNICDALGRPLREPHLEEGTALAAKADLLATGVRC